MKSEEPFTESIPMRCSYCREWFDLVDGYGFGDQEGQIICKVCAHLDDDNELDFNYLND